MSGGGSMGIDSSLWSTHLNDPPLISSPLSIPENKIIIYINKSHDYQSVTPLQLF